VSTRRGLTRNDAELLIAVLIWGFNMTVIKVGLLEVRPLAYNLVRFACASVVLLLLARWREGDLRARREDWGRLLLLGLLGHTLYQVCFIEGLARTTASSASLLFGSTPLVVALMSRLAGHERISPAGAIGALFGFYGVYSIVAGGSGGPVTARLIEGATAAGNLLVCAAVLCWSAYTVLARRLLQRYSPLKVTALTLASGTLFLTPLAVPDVVAQDWSSVSALAWAGIGYSFLFALVVSYLIWYRSVKAVGNLRTSIYSNLVPVVGTLFGVGLLGERLTAGLGVGAACILGGILMTRATAARS
jgi:drug/metabolite transporter (DMT)-like permease